LDPIGEPLASRDAVWSWMRTSIGMTVLIKHRPEPRPLPRGNFPSGRSGSDTHATSGHNAAHSTLFDDDDSFTQTENPSPATAAVPPESKLDHERTPAAGARVSLDDLFERLDGGIDDESLGKALREVARNGTRDQFAVFAGQLWASLRE
jgi:hypothetical protein